MSVLEFDKKFMLRLEHAPALFELELCSSF